MKKMPARNLQLSTTTVGSLDQRALAQVVGGRNGGGLQEYGLEDRARTANCPVGDRPCS